MATWEQQTTTFSMNIKSRECTTNMQWLCKTWHQSYPWKTKSAQDKLRSLRKNLTPLRKSEIHLYEHSHGIYEKLATSWLESWEIYIGSVWTSRKLVGRSIGVLLLSPKCARPTSRWPDASWTSVQFTSWWAENSFSSRSRILPYSKRPRSSASVRYKSPSWNIHGRRLERGRKLDWTQRRIAVIHSCAPSGGRSQAIIIIWRTSVRRSRRSPRSRSRCRSSTRCLKHHGTWHTSESCCSEYETLCSEGRFSDTSELYWFPETNENDHWCASWDNHRWLLQYWWRQVIVWTLDRCDKIRVPQQRSTRRTHVGFKAAWRRNRCLQDLHLAGRIVKQRGIYFIPDDDLNARRKLEIRRGPAMPCEVTTADPDGSSWRATLCRWTV